MKSHLLLQLLFLGMASCCASALLCFAPQTGSCQALSVDRTFLNRPHYDVTSRRSIGWQERKGIARSIISAPASTSTSSALSAMPAASTIAAAGATITNFYKAFPLIAGFLTASTKAAFADSMAQYHDVYTTKFNVKRNLAMVLYSGFVLGISVEVMYNHIFPLLFKTVHTSSAVVTALKMTLFDGFINAPLLWLPPAYIAKAIVYRYPKTEGIQRYIADVRQNGLLKKYWSLWLPMSMINFLFVPIHFRVAFVACVSFFWMIILSMVANNGE